jgi:hypothetical protein
LRGQVHIFNNLQKVFKGIELKVRRQVMTDLEYTHRIHPGWRGVCSHLPEKRRSTGRHIVLESLLIAVFAVLVLAGAFYSAL